MEINAINPEVIIRIVSFASIFFIMAVWELKAPRRILVTSKAVRWANNIAIVILDNLILRVVFPITAIELALYAQQQQWGLLNLVDVPVWLVIVVAVVLLDLIIYLQHLLFHAVPLLWRLHMMHHTDLDIDVTTGTRFHPIEILLSMLIKFAAIVVLGPHYMAVLIFEILLNATSMFNHSNVKIPGYVDRALRLFIVTPDMHRVHHSVIKQETNSNYGFNLPWWDRLFGTYKSQPEAGHKAMVIGLYQYRDPQSLNLPKLLVLPFTGNPADYPPD